MRRNLNVCVLSSHSPNVLHLTGRNSTRLLPDTLGKLDFYALYFARIASRQRFFPPFPPFFSEEEQGPVAPNAFALFNDHPSRPTITAPTRAASRESELFARPIPSATTDGRRD
jgi:hypothetical protein